MSAFEEFGKRFTAAVGGLAMAGAGIAFTGAAFFVALTGGPLGLAIAQSAFPVIEASFKLASKCLNDAATPQSKYDKSPDVGQEPSYTRRP